MIEKNWYMIVRATLPQAYEIWGVRGYKHSTITRSSTTYVAIVVGAANAAVGDLVAVANTSVAVCVETTAKRYKGNFGTMLKRQ